MGQAAKCSLLLVIAISWLLGGGFAWGPHLVGGLGILCLLLAFIEARHDRPLRKLWSWRVLPWILWVILIGISILNPSHLPKYEELARELTQPTGRTAKDTMGLANPSVPVDHIEWLPASSDPGRSAIYLFAMGGVMAFAIGLVLMPAGRKEIRRWLTIVFVNTVVLTLVGIWFYFDDKTLIFGIYKAEGHTPYASFHYKNVWVAYAILSASIGIGMAVRGWKAGQSLTSAKSPTAFFAFAIPLMLLSFPLIESRAGLVIGSLLVGWLLLVGLKNVLCQRQAGAFPVIPIVLGLLILGLGWFAWQTTGSQLERMLDKSENQLEQVTANDPTGRMVLMRDTIEMAKVKPWFGWGLATFSQVYPVFQGPELYTKVTFKGGEDFLWVPSYYEFTHCDWLQYLAETGIVGFLLLLATPLLWYIHYVRRGRANSLSHWLAVGSVLVLILATFEFPFGSEAVALLFAACLAMSGKYALLEGQAKRRRRRDSKRKGKRERSDAGEESEALTGIAG